MISAEIRKRLNVDAVSQLTDAERYEQIRQAVEMVASEKRMMITQAEQDQIAREVAADLTGLGPLQQLIDDEAITDIMVNGPDQIFADIRGKGRHLTDVTFRDRKHLEAVAQKIARDVGRKVDESTPLVDARLADGSRVNVVFSPIALDGASISIRKFPANSFQLDDLARLGAMSPDMARFLKLAASSRLNIIVSGGTGSGKTTLLNAITKYFGADDRIVTIEDAAELQVQQPHVVRMETRVASGEGGGAVTQTDLVKNALRMNPDRIILGEVRGGEAFDMLAAMNTGHDGSLATLHANNPRDALARLENMVLMAGFDLPARAIRTQIASAVDLVLQISKGRDGVRRINKISEINGMEGELIIVNDLFEFEIETVSAERIHGNFKAAKVKPTTLHKFRAGGHEREVSSIFGG
ncbi:CpaF family protein [Citreimonas salinaria]|uniref:CpaF family protein n=1 Tax=Citreimonas salinaria TaxID=321339 RepID=UPI0015A5B0F6|nr:CpaF family protein [Citreimonas salinaria]